MGHPIFYLLARSFRNRVRSSLRRLRRPKALIVTLFIVGYLGFSLFLVQMGRAGLDKNPSDVPMQFIGPLALMAITFIGWVSFRKSKLHPLGFRAADVQLLFALPISRRLLITYRLLTAQPWLLFMSFVLPIAFQQIPTIAPQALLTRWMVVNIGYLHFVVIAFAHGTPRSAGPRRVLFAWLPGILLAIWSIGGIATAGVSLEHLLSPEWSDEISRVASTESFTRAISPFRMIAETAVGRLEAGALPMASVWVLATLVAHLGWIFLQDNRFEEACVRSSEVLARRLEGWKRGEWGFSSRKPRQGAVTTQPFRLAPEGHPVWAYIWNGILAGGRHYTVRNGVIGLAVCIGLGTALRAAANRLGLETVEMGVLGFVLGGQIAMMTYVFFILGRRRVEIGMVEMMAVLKPLPVRGRTVFAGRLLGAVAITQSLYLLLWATVAAYSFDLVTRDILVGAGLAILSFVAIGALVGLGHALNMTLALWLPGTAAFKIGPEGFVHNLAALLYRVVGLIVLMLPPGIALALVASLSGASLATAFSCLAIGISIILTEVAALVYLGGWLYDRFDVVAEM